MFTILGGLLLSRLRNQGLIHSFTAKGLLKAGPKSAMLK